MLNTPSMSNDFWLLRTKGQVNFEILTERGTVPVNPITLKRSGLCSLRRYPDMTRPCSRDLTHRKTRTSTDSLAAGFFQNSPRRQGSAPPRLRRARDCCGLVLNKGLAAKREWRSLNRHASGFGARQQDNKSRFKSCFSSGPLFKSKSGSFFESTAEVSRVPRVLQSERQRLSHLFILSNI
jgi:hypothetical protein